MVFLSLLLSVLSFAAATSTCSDNPSFRRFSFGGVNGVVVSDGPAFFATNAFLVPDAALARNFAASFRPVTPAVFQQNVVILDLPVGRVMVDAGSVNIPQFPQFDTAGKLLTNMEAAGISPDSIDGVIFTHAHADHVSGVVTADGKAVFPNAKLYIGEEEHEFFADENLPNPNPATIPNGTMEVLNEIYLRSIEPYGDRLVLVPENGSPIPGVKFVPTPGHSPGHNSVRFSSKGERLLVTGDSWITKPDQLENPEWQFFIESDANQAYKSRIRILSSAARRRDLVLSYHEAFPGLGRVSINGAAFSWTPAQTQSMGTGVKTQC